MGCPGINVKCPTRGIEMHGNALLLSKEGGWGLLKLINA